MKKHTYTLIGLLVLAGPLALSFDDKVYFIQYLIPVAGAALVGGLVFIVWDILAVKRNHWSFNDDFVGSFRIAHLPPGEWVFFMGVPYACIFIYEVVLAYYGDYRLQAGETLVLFTGYGLALGGLIFGFRQKRGYTCWVSYAFSGVILLVSFFSPEIWLSSAFWTFMGLSLIAFLLVNGTYVNLPTIRYNPDNCSDLRVIGIPVEDFFYNFSYLVLIIFCYLNFKQIPGILLGEAA